MLVQQCIPYSTVPIDCAGAVFLSPVSQVLLSHVEGEGGVIDSGNHRERCGIRQSQGGRGQGLRPHPENALVLPGGVRASTRLGRGVHLRGAHGKKPCKSSGKSMDQRGGKSKDRGTACSGGEAVRGGAGKNDANDGNDVPSSAAASFSPFRLGRMMQRLSWTSFLASRYRSHKGTRNSQQPAVRQVIEWGSLRRTGGPSLGA